MFLLLLFYELLGEQNGIAIKPLTSSIVGMALSVVIGCFAFVWLQADHKYKVFETTGNEQALNQAMSLNPFATKNYLAKVHSGSSLQDDILISIHTPEALQRNEKLRKQLQTLLSSEKTTNIQDQRNFFSPNPQQFLATNKKMNPAVVVAPCQLDSGNNKYALGA